MATLHTTLSPEEQREFQITAFNLPADTTWLQLRAHVRRTNTGSIFLDPEDWDNTMVRLYGSEIFESH